MYLVCKLKRLGSVNSFGDIVALSHGILDLATIAGCVLEVEYFTLISADECVSLFSAILIIWSVSLADSTNQVEFIHVLEQTLNNLKIVFNMQIGAQVPYLCDVAHLRKAIHKAVRPLDYILFA